MTDGLATFLGGVGLGLAVGASLAWFVGRRALGDTFRSLSAQALQANNQSFLDLARTAFDGMERATLSQHDSRVRAVSELLRPLDDSLRRMDSSVNAVEHARIEAYAALREQIVALSTAHNRLEAETAHLTQVLRAPQARGRWGEIQLRRVVELAGMLPHCDFEEQASGKSDEGRSRPDLIIRLPGGRQVVVDAKAPMSAYLDAMDATGEDERQRHLGRHALQVKEHLRRLAQKSYWADFQPSPEFVVMFLPGEAFFSAALLLDPTLIETGLEQGVLLASPTTLIALLRAVAEGWRHDGLAHHAKEISELGRSLHERLATLSGHFAEMGSHLGRAVGAFNRAGASFENRVMVAARRFRDLGAGAEEIQAVPTIDEAPRASASHGGDPDSPT